MIMPEPAVDPKQPTPEQAAELRATLSLLYRRIRRTRVAGELTLAEGSALSRLDQQGATTAAQLAELEQISPQSIGVTLQTLELRKLIQRAQDPDDGRRVILSLTDAGRATVHSKRTARTEQLTRALAALSPQDRAQLIAALPVLERLAQVM
jgi:DNA-binding MarR family transcriptional regulator